MKKRQKIGIRVFNSIVLIIVSSPYDKQKRAGIGQSVQRLATGWAVPGSNPGVTKFSASVQIGPEVHPVSYKMGIRYFSWG
jgi:hypothetical protein